MVSIIKSGSDKKLCFSLESTRGFPAKDLVRRRLGDASIRFEPAEALGPGGEAGDRVLAGISTHQAGQAAARWAGLRVPPLPAGGYSIRYVKSSRGNCLLVLGGDLFGMLAGLSDALLWSEVSSGRLTYRGGDRLEKPAFPLRYYWTWDHSTNWVLDDPGNQVSGCQNRYLKKPGTYLEDYKRLVDHCIQMRFNGIVIWGFLRDAHGGETAAYEVAQYAADRGVAIMPGVGTTGYGGIYYDGHHPFNLETYLARHPERGNFWVDSPWRKDGPSDRELSPYSPQNQAWIRGCVEWLYRHFPIGGANLENCDLMVDHSAAAKRARAQIKSGEEDHFKDQFFAYKTALDVADTVAPQAWNTYATYTGFGRGKEVGNAGPNMGRVPYFARHMPPSAIAQWTLSGMLSGKPARLREWLEHSRPPCLYENPRWPEGLRPPTPRSAGFIHQGSQWSWPRRTDLALSQFAEGCLRGAEAGLEGISVHGEVTSRILAWNLNYLAMRHWTYHPVSSLEEFALAELAPRLGGEKEAGFFVETLCRLQERKLDAADEKKIRDASQYCGGGGADGAQLGAWHMWEELLEWHVLRRDIHYPLGSGAAGLV